MIIDDRALTLLEIQEVNAVIDKHYGSAESKSTTDKEEYIQSSSGPDAIELINGGEQWIVTDRNESGAVYYRDGRMLHVACRELYEVCAKFSLRIRAARRLLKFSDAGQAIALAPDEIEKSQIEKILATLPLTPEQADAEFDASPAIPLTSQEIDRIVDFATKETPSLNPMEQKVERLRDLLSKQRFRDFYEGSFDDWLTGVYERGTEDARRLEAEVNTFLEGMIVRIETGV